LGNSSQQPTLPRKLKAGLAHAAPGSTLHGRGFDHGGRPVGPGRIDHGLCDIDSGNWPHARGNEFAQGCRQSERGSLAEAEMSALAAQQARSKDHQRSQIERRQIAFSLTFDAVIEDSARGVSADRADDDHPPGTDVHCPPAQR
jgi:hypothetical protein